MKLHNTPTITGNQASLTIKQFDLQSYLDLLEVRSIPQYQAVGRTLNFPARYLGEVIDHRYMPLKIVDGDFDYQTMLTKIIWLKRRYAIFLDPGLGKCHGFDTPVIMYDGSIRMVQDIRKGEQLLGPDSKPRNVLSVTKGYGPLYKVTPTKGEPFVCNDAHILSLKASGTKKNSNDARYIHDKVTNISVIDYLNENTYFKEKMKLWRTGVDFDDIPVECDPYITGTWLGDGTVNSPDITTNNNDAEVIDYLEKWATEYGLTVSDRGGNGCKTRGFVTKAGQRNWFRTFVQSLYVGNEKRIPRNYLVNSHEVRLELLAGILDADAYFVDNCYEIVTIYNGLANDIAFLARSLGLGVTRKLVTKGIKSSGFSGKYHKLLIYGETDKIPNKLPRKKSQPRKQVKSALVTGFKVEYLGEGDYYGFTLDSDHLYLLGDFTVTHNTRVMAQVIRQLHASNPTQKIIFCTELNPLSQGFKMCQALSADFPDSIYLYNNKDMTFAEWVEYDNVPRIGFINHETFIRYNKNLADKVCGFFLDESSVLRGGAGGNGKIAKNIIAATKGIDVKVASSGTPAPNSDVEYAMHALYLEYVTSENEYLQQFFLKKEGKWTMRKWAKDAFFADLSTWSFFMRNPKSYGFNDNLKDMPPITEHLIHVPMTDEQLKLLHEKWGIKGRGQRTLNGIALVPHDMGERSKFSQVSKGFYYWDEKITDANGKEGKRRHTEHVHSLKPQRIIDIINSHPDDNILIRVVYDEEGAILERAFKEAGYDYFHITAQTKIPTRLEAIDCFASGTLRILMGKAEVLGKGLNLQENCHIFIVSGQSDSFEDDYQFKKRLHRIGQTKEVLLYRVYTDYELVTLENVFKKQKRADRDFQMQEHLYRQSLYAELQEYLEKGDFGFMMTERIKHAPQVTKDYQIYHTNSLATMLAVLDKHNLADKRKLEPYLEKWLPGNEDCWLDVNSIDFSIFSEPFMSDRFTYSNDIGDMGNTKGAGALGGVDEFMIMRRFFLQGLLAVTKPGRFAAMHVEQVALMKGVDGTNGYYDYRGRAIEEARRCGWIPWADIPIIKNQQALAAVKHVSSLAMGNMWQDRTRLAPALNGYLIVMKKPGENEKPVSDIFRCSCGWQGDYEECDLSLNRNTPLCPNCGNQKMQSDMNFDKWVRDAMGGWFESEEDDNAYEFARMTNKEVCNRMTKDYAKQMIDALKGVISGNYDDQLLTELGLWYDIRETDILPGLARQDKEALEADKHLCPLPRTIAKRAIRLWSNENDLVHSPFMGSGTEGVEALKLNRRFIGEELKPEYFMMALANIRRATEESMQIPMFDLEALRV